MISRGKMGNWDTILTYDKSQRSIEWHAFIFPFKIIWKELWLRVYIEHRKKNNKRMMKRIIFVAIALSLLLCNVRTYTIQIMKSVVTWDEHYLYTHASHATTFVAHPWRHCCDVYNIELLFKYQIIFLPAECGIHTRENREIKPNHTISM